MPIPEHLQDVINRRRFWTDFTYGTIADEEDYLDMESVHVDFPITADSKLTLSFDSSMSNFSLKFHGGWEHGVEIGDDNRAFCFRNVLRWHELDLICRAATRYDPLLGQHPGLPLLLLYRFAPICVGDDVVWIAGMLRSAYRSVVGDASCGGFSDAEIRRSIEGQVDARDAFFEWHYHEQGRYWWVAKGDGDGGTISEPFMSLRCEGEIREGFPTRAWEDTLAGAEQLMGPSQHRLSEPTPTTSGASDTEMMAHIPRLRRGFRLEIPFRGFRLTIRPAVHPEDIAQTINALLKVLSLGVCDRGRATGPLWVGPYRLYITGSNTTNIHLYRDSVDRGLRVIKETLWWATAPATCLRLTDARRQHLPFDLEEDVAGEAQLQGLLCFQLGRINPEDGAEDDPEDEPREPIVTQLEPSCREMANAFVDAEGMEVQAPSTVTTKDGGVVEFNFEGWPTDPLAVSGTLVLDRLSPMASEVVYNCLAAHDLILLPAGITASQLPEREGWTPHVVASASELHRILEAGPCRWWWDRYTDCLNEIHE